MTQVGVITIAFERPDGHLAQSQRCTLHFVRYELRLNTVEHECSLRDWTELYLIFLNSRITRSITLLAGVSAVG
jgi:hypothetical protein